MFLFDYKNPSGARSVRGIETVWETVSKSSSRGSCREEPMAGTPPRASDAMGAAEPLPVAGEPVDVDNEDFSLHLHVEDVGVAVVEECAFLATPLTLDERRKMGKKHVDVLENVAVGEFATDFGVVGGLRQVGIADGRFVRRHLLRFTRKDEVVEVARRPQTFTGLEEVVRVDGVAGDRERGQVGEASFCRNEARQKFLEGFGIVNPALHHLRRHVRSVFEHACPEFHLLLVHDGFSLRFSSFASGLLRS